MSDKPWTPGPWKAFRQTVTPEGDTGGSIRIYVMSGRNMMTGKDLVPGEEKRSTATLISAAPDLYEALEVVRDADDDHQADGGAGIPKQARAKIDAALAKASGEDG